MSEPITLKCIVTIVGGKAGQGLDLARAITRLASLTDADETSLSWLDGRPHLESARQSRAVAIVTSAEFAADLPRTIEVADVQAAVADLLDLFGGPVPAADPGIHMTAVVDPTATVAPSASIGPHAVIRAGATVGERTIVEPGVSIGRGVSIGSDCRLYDRVVIYDGCTLGDRVTIHAGSVIGGDGFGYIFREGQHRKLRHIGTVVIEDDVEIGACTTVDRAKVGETRIGRGSKIDNLVQVAHNVSLGPLCILVGHVGLSGSVRLGVGCVVGGQVGLADGVILADGTRVAARSGVMHNFTEPNQTIMGEPAQDHTARKRELLRIKRLPQLFERVAAMEKRVASLEGAKND